MRDAVCVIGALAVCFAGNPAAASPLPDNDCVSRMSEFVAIKSTGIDADIGLGAEAARSRLGPDKLLQIKRYFELEADLTFRCPNYAMTGPGAPHNIPERNPRPRRAEVVEAPVLPTPAVSRGGDLPVPTRKPSKS